MDDSAFVSTTWAFVLRNKFPLMNGTPASLHTVIPLVTLARECLIDLATMNGTEHN